LRKKLTGKGRLPSTVRTRNDVETKIRIATAKEPPCKEITGFIDCGDYIAFFVLFTIGQLETKNRRKLGHLLKYSVPSNITFNNTKVIEQALEKVTIKDREEKSELFRRVAIWYSEMGDDQNALKYRRLSQKEFEKNYLNIKPLISLELRSGNSEKVMDYSALLFRMDPTNPTVMQDILSIYHIGKFNAEYLKLIDSLKAEFSENHEAMGNIYFHHGIRLIELGNVNGAIDCMNSAKVEFMQVYDKAHYVFEQIEKNLYFFQQSKSSDPE
jgi:ribonucleotide reductase alpha subunit